MSNNDVIETDGIVKEILPGSKFRIELPNGNLVMGHPSGKMRMHSIKMIPGDMVKIELSKYDLTKGRITFRGKKR